jgi:hypothetical protein
MIPPVLYALPPPLAPPYIMARTGFPARSLFWTREGGMSARKKRFLSGRTPADKMPG